MSYLPPPVPQALRDMLKDYPEYLQTLQDDLNKVMAKPFRSTPLFEQAIWALEGALDAFVSEAKHELEAAKEAGDVAAIEQAEKKDFAVGSASFKGRWLGEENGLWDYFQNHHKGI